MSPENRDLQEAIRDIIEGSDYFVYTILRRFVVSYGWIDREHLIKQSQENLPEVEHIVSEIRLEYFAIFYTLAVISKEKMEENEFKNIPMFTPYMQIHDVFLLLKWVIGCGVKEVIKFNDSFKHPSFGIGMEILGVIGFNDEIINLYDGLDKSERLFR